MTDIAELFARDPLKLTNEDITSMIHELRRLRENFIAGQRAPLKPKAAKSLTPAGAGLSLKDLGLE